MMKIYRSKIDYWLVLPLAFPFYLSIRSISKGEWLGVFVFFLLGALILIASIFTKYIVDNDALIVKSALMVREKIDIHSIRKIEKTNSILSAPASSLDRIRIYYNKFDEILLSPKEKQDFVNTLLEINPAMEVKL
ncbi:PH domain-containing protein [Flavobacterium sp.]|uniref:PH domain-containing protein n=1 Tax=Flavobacterium sp. TaxID=239 RepID=UPI003D69FFB3